MTTVCYYYHFHDYWLQICVSVFFKEAFVLLFEPHTHTLRLLVSSFCLGVFAQEILEMLDNDSSEICEHVLKNAVLTAGEKAAW